METFKNTDKPTDALGRNNIDQVTSGAHDSIDRISEAARPAVDKLASGAHEAVDSITDMASSAAETLEEKSARLKEAQARLMESATNYVHDHPVASLGIAVATGFVLSRLLTSGSSSNAASSHR